MSMDRLQEKIRKTKSPILLELDATKDQLPPHLLEQEGSFIKAHTRFCVELMESLRGSIPAVRFSFSAFALQGTEGLTALSYLLEQAKKLGYYVLMDIPEALSAQRAAANAQTVFSEEFPWQCDGVIVSAYIGSDAIRPYAALLEQEDRAMFIAVRTGNRSAVELQDLLTGSRHVFEAVTDVVNRFKNDRATKSGYDRVAIIGPATSAPVLKRLREKYKNLFILVDGYDYSGANAKNCAAAADQFGHGIIVCAGASICAAWSAQEHDGLEYLDDAKEAVERMKKNLARYFTVM